MSDDPKRSAIFAHFAALFDTMVKGDIEGSLDLMANPPEGVMSGSGTGTLRENGTIDLIQDALEEHDRLYPPLSAEELRTLSPEELQKRLTTFD